MGKFARDLKRIAEKQKRDIREVVRGSLFDLGSMIIIQSPVDTGRFRLNWQFDIGEMTYSSNLGTASPHGARKEAEGKLLAKLGEFNMGQVFYMYNNLQYAIPLEYGHSGQAPQGMIRTSVPKFKSYIANRAKFSR